MVSPQRALAYGVIRAESTSREFLLRCRTRADLSCRHTDLPVSPLEGCVAPASGISLSCATFEPRTAPRPATESALRPSPEPVLLACTAGWLPSVVAWTPLPEPKFSARMLAAAPLLLTTNPCPPPELVTCAAAVLLSAVALRAMPVGPEASASIAVGPEADRPTLAPVADNAVAPTALTPTRTRPTRSPVPRSHPTRPRRHLHRRQTRLWHRRH